MAEFADNLLDKMSSTPAFKPVNVNSFGDWSIEAGDIITTTVDGTSETIPIFSSDMSWNGSCDTTLSNSGNTEREVQKKQDREEYNQENEVENSLSGLRSSLGGLSTTVDGIKTAYEELVARVDDAEAGIKACVTVDTFNGYKESVVKTYATISEVETGLQSKVSTQEMKDELGSYLTKTAASEMYVDLDTLDGKVDARIGVYAVSDGKGKSRSFAQIAADLTSIDSTVTSFSGIINAEKSTISATSITADGIGATSNFYYQGDEVTAKSITSSDSTVYSVLGV